MSPSSGHANGQPAMGAVGRRRHGCGGQRARPAARSSRSAAAAAGGWPGSATGCPGRRLGCRFRCAQPGEVQEGLIRHSGSSEMMCLMSRAACRQHESSCAQALQARPGTAVCTELTFCGTDANLAMQQSECELCKELKPFVLCWALLGPVHAVQLTLQSRVTDLMLPTANAHCPLSNRPAQHGCTVGSMLAPRNEVAHVRQLANAQNITCLRSFLRSCLRSFLKWWCCSWTGSCCSLLFRKQRALPFFAAFSGRRLSTSANVSQVAVARLDWKRLLQPWQRTSPFFADIAADGAGDIISAAAARPAAATTATPEQVMPLWHMWTGPQHLKRPAVQLF